MKGARLVIVGGPRSGEEFPLDGGCSIGRHKSNRIAIPDLAASRQHCIVERRGDSFALKDLGSRNGTLVNGSPVAGDRALEHGDQFRVGESVFLLVCDEWLPAQSAPDDSEEQTHTVFLSQEDSRYLRAETSPAPGRPDGLKTLVRVATTIAAARKLDTLAESLMPLVLDAIPAEHAAILRVSTDGQLTSGLYWSRAGRLQRPRSVSGTVVETITRDRVAVLRNPPALGDVLASLQRLSVTSVVAAPLVAMGRLYGILYLDTTSIAALFDEEDLELLAGIAAIAGPALANVVDIGHLEGERRRLEASLDIGHDMIGRGPRISEVFGFIAKAAPSEATVLIRGESGTGKELVARAIHRNSPRTAKPFVAINCAALTETLLESELFGHEKGAFTGAIAQKKGKFEEANGGTVFLDEIGEMAPLLQAKLLRAIQEREFERVGGTRPVKADVRLIAATNRDLEAAVKEGRFRQDLFYRLNVVVIRMPALRDRREDIPLLAEHFVQKHGRRTPRRIEGVSAQALEYLIGYDWPGNIRQLENSIERALVLGSSEWIEPDDLPEEVLEVGQAPAGDSGERKFHELVRETKRQLVEKAREEAGGKFPEMARLLGLHPNNLRRLMRSLDLS